MRIALGMDLHKDLAVCHAVYAGDGVAPDDDQAFLDRFNGSHRRQRARPEDMHDIVHALDGHEVHVLIENSTKTFETYWTLTFLGCHVTVAQARDLYRITKSVTKNDENDACELAHYMRRRLHGEDEFAECVMPSKEWMIKRELCRTVFNEKEHLADLKRRTRAHLLLHGIRLSREYPEIFAKKAIKEMTALDDPILKIYIKEAETLQERVSFEAKYIDHLFSGDRMFHLIHSIPGFGKISAAYLTSLIMDIGRFDNCNQFTANFGVVPKQRDSADTKSRCATTHRGDVDARRLLKQAAFVHSQTVEDSVVSEMYRRLRSRGKAHNEVLVACARKLLTVVWSVLRSGRTYTSDPGLLKAAREMADSEETLAME